MHVSWKWVVVPVVAVLGLAACPKRITEGDVTDSSGRGGRWSLSREGQTTTVIITEGKAPARLVLDDKGLMFEDRGRALYFGCNFPRCRKFIEPGAEGKPSVERVEANAERFPWSEFRVELAQAALDTAARSDPSLSEDAQIFAAFTTIVANTAPSVPNLAGGANVEPGTPPLEPRPPVERLPDGGVVGVPTVSVPPATCKGDERKLFGGKLLVANANFAPWPVRVSFTVGELNGSSNCYTEPFECIGAPTAGSSSISPTITNGAGCPDGFQAKSLVVQGKILATQGLWCRPGAEDTGVGVGLTVEIANVRTLEIAANQLTASNLLTSGRAWVDYSGASCYKPASGHAWWAEEASATWVAGPAPSNGACYEPSCEQMPPWAGAGAATGTPSPTPVASTDGGATLAGCCQCTGTAGSACDVCAGGLSGTDCFNYCQSLGQCTVNYLVGKSCVGNRCQ